MQPQSYDDAIAEISRLREGLSLIVTRADKIARPNGTTKVLGRIATATLTGQDVHVAAARA